VLAGKSRTATPALRTSMTIEGRRSNRLVFAPHYDSGLKRANGEGWQTGKILRA
jgi:hypothetical protein